MREYKEVRRQTPDPEAAAPYLGYARELLGQMKSEMARGGIDQLSRTKHLPDGAVVTVRSRFGQDTVNIQVPRPTLRHPGTPGIPVDIREAIGMDSDLPPAAAPVPISNGLAPLINAPAINAPAPAPPILSPQPVIEDLGVEIPPVEPEELPTEEEVKLDEPEQEEVFDEARISYTYWILFSGEDANHPYHIDAWSPAAGFTGRSVTLTPNTAAVVIYNGFVWWVQLYQSFSDSTSRIYRANITTGSQELLYERHFDGAHGAASTVTPRGIMFVIGNTDAVTVLLGIDGSVTYTESIGFIGIAITALVNNGVTAFVSSGQGADTRHDYEYSIDIATGAYSDNGGDYTAQGDADGQGPSACMAGGALYGVRVESTGEDSTSQAYAYARVPANNGSAAIGSVGQNTEGRSGVYSSAAAMTLNGTPVLVTAYEMSVVDKAGGSISSVSIGIDNSASANQVNKGVSIIPVGRQIAFMYNNTKYPSGPAEHVMVIYNVGTGAISRYVVDVAGPTGVPFSRGYLIQYQVFPAINPKPTDPPFLPEWVYLSHTTVNP